MSQEIKCPKCNSDFSVDYTDWLNSDGDESEEECPECQEIIRVIANISVDINIKEK
tara:strand:+ start:313 stop:480 length:168 start_codon:yes stop_codon:yes gene_type:complete